MELARTVSAENARTRNPLLLAGAGNATAASRKGLASEETSDASAARASYSMPPPASKAVARQFPSRRPSRASDISLFETSAILDDADSLTPPVDVTRPPIDAASGRLSFSSLYSIGSGIYPSTHRMSGPASNSGSDEGTCAPAGCSRLLTRPLRRPQWHHHGHVRPEHHHREP
jgi:inositol hexakisphosphate/diphosphoinositol-pentakisphosphate kinase